MSDTKKDFNPSDFMRARRPELFSDTVQSQETIADLRQFEYYLETLTQRKEETLFEHFCRRLAERELCPNLVVQTGPTGGGDSKTDTETYPVSPAVANRWYVGSPDLNGKERWAFAFSAKKQWRGKVRSDVQKIAETGRGYKLIYFIGNQPIRDKDRADVEDELRKKWKIPVRILDRSWIVNTVQKNNRWDLVFQTLDFSQPSVMSVRPGPLDTERQAELDELERLIGDPTRYQGSEYQLVQDCLQAAILARSLGKPRVEVDGRFVRAERIAATNHQDRDRFLILYQRAWAAFWWFDDYSEMDRIYPDIEGYGLQSDWVWDTEKLVNLWHIGRGWNHEAFAADPRWAERTTNLRAALSRHCKNGEKPTSALWARTLLVLMDLFDAAANKEQLSAIVERLRGIVKEARDHSEYPMTGLANMLQELGNIPQISEAFGTAIEELIEIERSRKGESAEGQLRLQRGIQLLKQEKTYDAITQIARAQILLAKEETYGDFVEAVAVTGLAFEAAGLLWAARGNILTALNRVLVSYFRDGKIAPQALALCRKLVWLELQLGRPTWVQIWWEWIATLLHATALSEGARTSLDEEFRMMDAILGILVLRTPLIDLRSLDRMPLLYERTGLHMAREAMLFALGHEDAVSTEWMPHGTNLEDAFRKWLTQPAAEDVPARPEWFLEKKISMRTQVLGCQIELVAENNATTVLLGESLLAFIESFFSTVIAGRGRFASLPYLKVELRQSEFADAPFSQQENEDDCGEVSLILAHPKGDLSALTSSPTTNPAYLKFLLTLVFYMRINFSEEFLNKLLSEEHAQDRAALSARSLLAIENILTDKPKYQVDAWTTDLVEGAFVLRRTDQPLALTVPPKGEAPSKLEGFKFSSGKPPPELSGIDALKHTDLKTVSLINVPLWDRAKWKGLGFTMRQGEPPIPGLVFAFADMDAGVKIFRGWRKSVGQVDSDDRIGVTIVRGIDRKNPSHYRVVVGLNENAFQRDALDSTFFTLVYRIQEMTPPDSTNLNMFLDYYEKAGHYFLAAGQFAGTSPGPYANSLEIDKTHLRVVDSWQVGEEDPIRVVIDEDDDPVIPSDIPDVPILKWFKKQKP